MSVSKKDKELYLYRIGLACKIARQKGAIFNEAVVTAQGALESCWGLSELAKKGNNLFGIKAGKSWSGDTIEFPTREWSGEKGWYWTTAKWRKYLSWNLCIVDYSKLIASLPWFEKALDHADDAERFLKELLPGPPSKEWPKGKPGWATDPMYACKLKLIALEIEDLGGVRWG